MLFVLRYWRNPVFGKKPIHTLEFLSKYFTSLLNRMNDPCTEGSSNSVGADDSLAVQFLHRKYTFCDSQSNFLIQ